MVYQRVKGCIFTLFILFSYSSYAQAAGELWFNGFGTVKFGDICKYKTAKYEMHEHNGFTIKAHCFSYRGIQTNVITSVSIYANDLTLEAAKRIINQHIKKKDRRTNLYWASSASALPGSKGLVLWPNGALPKTDRRGYSCITNAPNNIEIIEYKDPIKFQKQVGYGSIEIKIWANKLRCETKIKIDDTIKKDKTEKIENELNSNTAKSLLNSFN